MSDFKRGDKHPTEPDKYFWQYKKQLSGTYEIWVSFETWERWVKKSSEARRKNAGIRKAARIQRKRICQGRSANKAEEIRRLLARGKSESYIMTACNVPQSLIRAAQQAA